MRKFLLFYLLLMTSVTGVDAAMVKKQAASHPKKVYQLQFDSSKIAVRALNADALKKYSNSPDFSYSEKKKSTSVLSFWARFWVWLWDLILRLFSVQSGPGGGSIPYLSYIIGFATVAFLVYVLFRLAGLDYSNILKRKAKNVNIPYSESLENIHQITFDDEIEKALNSRNYRLAVRLLYLRTLKQLNDAQLIDWQIEKTNSVYLNELTNPAQQHYFGILTRQFEYIWYGDFPIDSRSFQNINLLFHDFKISPK